MYIRIYTCASVETPAVKIVKIRRVGNSNVISLPRELEQRGYSPGTAVLVQELPDGELRVVPAERLRRADPSFP